MACAPAPSCSTNAAPTQSAERALFTLLKPIKGSLSGVEIDIQRVEMRALDSSDLPLLDQFRGQPIALLQGVVAALCDLEFDQVRQMDFADFTMLASDAVFQIEQFSMAVGLAADFFIQSPGEEPAIIAP